MRHAPIILALIFILLISTSLFAIPMSIISGYSFYQSDAITSHRINAGMTNNTTFTKGVTDFNRAYVNTPPDGFDYGEDLLGGTTGPQNILSTTIPEPVTLVLFGVGLAGLGFLRKNK